MGTVRMVHYLRADKKMAILTVIQTVILMAVLLNNQTNRLSNPSSGGFGIDFTRGVRGKKISDSRLCRRIDKLQQKFH